MHLSTPRGAILRNLVTDVIWMHYNWGLSKQPPVIKVANIFDHGFRTRGPHAARDKRVIFSQFFSIIATTDIKPDIDKLVH